MSKNLRQMANARGNRLASFGLVLLAALNLLCLIDRYLLPALQPMIKREFAFSDRQLGALSSGFFFVFMVAAPLTGWLGDRFRRKPLIIGATLLWSAFTFLTIFCTSYRSLFLIHSLFAVGEAAFAVYAPALIADFYPAGERTQALTFFSLTVPIGAALGFTLAGFLASGHSWRFPFTVLAATGVLLALLTTFFFSEPKRGASDLGTSSTSSANLLGLWRNPAYVRVVFAYICLSFAMVGSAIWLPTFIIRTTHAALPHVNKTLGFITMFDGVAGVFLGGLLAQRWSRTNPRALTLFSGSSMILAVPFGLFLLFGPLRLLYPALVGTQFLFFSCTAPLTAILLNSVGARIRSNAVAISLFAAHAFGDTLSPTLIGWLSDRRSLPVGMAFALIPLIFGGTVLFTTKQSQGSATAFQKVTGAGSEKGLAGSV